MCLPCPFHGAPANYIPVYWMSGWAALRVGSCSYSLCTVWICWWNKGDSNVFSKWLLRHICPSPVMNFTPEATALINHTLVGHLITPQRLSFRWIGTSLSRLALLSLDWLSWFSFCSQFRLLPCSWGWQWFRNVALGPGLDQNWTITKFPVRVVNTPAISIRAWFNGNLPTHLHWAGCQRVVLRVYL